MEARELRADNFVIDEYGRIVQIESVNKNGLLTVTPKHQNDSVHWIDEMKPIPLTEEWLQKFGFKRRFITDADWYHPSNNIKLMFSVDSADSYWHGKQIRELLHVHQLQNLYYVLTEEELHINTQS